MSLRLLVDMNLSPVWVDWLNVRGYTAVHWSSIGSPRASDRTVLAWTLVGHRAAAPLRSA